MNITFVTGVNMVVVSSSISAKVNKMSCQEYKGYKWQCHLYHSRPHNNTVSLNKKFCVDQVMPPPPPPGEGQRVGHDKGWGGPPFRVLN